MGPLLINTGTTIHEEDLWTGARLGPGFRGFAGAQVVTQVQSTAPAAGASSEIRRVSQLLGAIVQLRGLNNFGRVEDAVIDDNEAMANLVVSSNGPNVMLPWGEGNFSLGQPTAVYSIAPQAVEPLFFEAGASPNVWGPSI